MKRIILILILSLQGFFAFCTTIGNQGLEAQSDTATVAFYSWDSKLLANAIQLLKDTCQELVSCDRLGVLSMRFDKEVQAFSVASFNTLFLMRPEDFSEPQAAVLFDSTLILFDRGELQNDTLFDDMVFVEHRSLQLVIDDEYPHCLHKKDEDTWRNFWFDSTLTLSKSKPKIELHEFSYFTTSGTNYKEKLNVFQRFWKWLSD